MSLKQVIVGMTGASPVTTIHGVAWLCHAVKGRMGHDRACPCHAPYGSTRGYKFSNSYPDAYGHLSTNHI